MLTRMTGKMFFRYHARMPVFQTKLSIATPGRGTQLITDQVAAAVRDSGIQTGIAQLFILHTSAGLVITENADPQVRSDLETYLADAAPDGDPRFKHVDEGPDDMPAHVRTLLTETSLLVPVSGGRPVLGTWQGIYVYEHRQRGHTRQIVVTVSGE